MLDININNFIIGFAIAATPGAVLIETIRRSLYDRNTVLGFTLGNFVGLALIIFATLLGMTTITDNASVQPALYTLGGMTMIYMGLKAVISKPKYHIVHRKALNLKDDYAVFSLGFLLSISNPIRLIFWGAIVGVFLYESSDITYAIANSFSIYIGMLLFYVMIIGCLWKTGSYIKHRYILVFSRLMGAVIIGLGLSTLFRVVS